MAFLFFSSAGLNTSNSILSRSHEGLRSISLVSFTAFSTIQGHYHCSVMASMTSCLDYSNNLLFPIPSHFLFPSIPYISGRLIFLKLCSGHALLLLKYQYFPVAAKINTNAQTPMQASPNFISHPWSPHVASSMDNYRKGLPYTDSLWLFHLCAFADTGMPYTHLSTPAVIWNPMKQPWILQK